jgi:hypothetical protein
VQIQWGSCRGPQILHFYNADSPLTCRFHAPRETIALPSKTDFPPYYPVFSTAFELRGADLPFFMQGNKKFV